MVNVVDRLGRLYTVRVCLLSRYYFNLSSTKEFRIFCILFRGLAFHTNLNKHFFGGKLIQIVCDMQSVFEMNY